LLVSGRPVVSGGLAARGGESIHFAKPRAAGTFKYKKERAKRQAREQTVEIGSFARRRPFKARPATADRGGGTSPDRSTNRARTYSNQAPRASRADGFTRVGTWV
jgi:hypothetical protein